MNLSAEKEILERAATALERQTNLQVQILSPIEKPGKGSDYRVTFLIQEENQPKQFIAEIKKNINSAIISEAASQARQSEAKFVLVTEYVSEPQAEKLRELNVSYFDTVGNAYFKEPGLYIFVSGQKREVKRERVPRLFRPPGMKILFAFLTQTGLENESYRRISAVTNVPTPTVGVFMADLKKAGYLMKRDKNERRLIRRNELFRRFIENYGESFRQTLHPVRFRSQKHDGRWWENVEIEKFNACWGGETGGAILTKHLKPEIATIYADSIMPRLQAQYGLVRDERGNVEILRKFWTSGEVGNVAPPLVVYADLISTLDGRNLETAQIIYDRYLSKIAETVA